MNEISIIHYLTLGFLIFIIGLIGSIISKHVIKVLISIEFILTGVNINFITFAKYYNNVSFDGYILSLFYIAIGAVELAVAIYIFYFMYSKKQSENLEDYGDL